MTTSIVLAAGSLMACIILSCVWIEALALALAAASLFWSTHLGGLASDAYVVLGVIAALVAWVDLQKRHEDNIVLRRTRAVLATATTSLACATVATSTLSFIDARRVRHLVRSAEGRQEVDRLPPRPRRDLDPLHA